ncbi:hypothetical protein [Streptomyces sp. NBC_00649]|uniref:effector-associated constant component EACC1 n=1 Tax=Streptomyces sp. NBC_00649 TaxID=2975798 RepID=UPI003255B705
MRVTVSVGSSSDDGAGAVAGGALDLRRWLVRQPELSGVVVPLGPGVPQRGTMGAVGDVVALLLEPGGMTAVLAAAVVTWLQNRRGNQTVTITLADGTQIVVATEKVRGLTAQGTSELAQRVAEAIGEREPGSARRAEGRREDAADDGGGRDGQHPL